MNDVGEPDEGEPHVRFDGRELGTEPHLTGHPRVPGRCAERTPPSRPERDPTRQTPDHRTSSLPDQPHTVVIERFHRAGWVIWVCILLFPIGLFALLAPKRVDRGTVAVSDNGKGTVTLRIAGTFHGTSEAAVNGVIARGSSVQDGPTVDEIAEEMRKLNELRERGVLTSEEYEAQKKRLLP